MMNSLKRIGKKVKATNTAGVVSELGSFGGLFKAPGKDSLLVSSVDGVGTKLKVASMANKHNTVGQDLVNHCVNDIRITSYNVCYTKLLRKYPSVVDEDKVAKARRVLRNGSEVGQMMKVVGEEGTSIDDFVLYLKSEYIDATYLQQNAFNETDAANSVITSYSIHYTKLYDSVTGLRFMTLSAFSLTSTPLRSSVRMP